MAAEFNDKLYFVGSGYPTNNLVEIDPINNTSNVVFESTALDSAFSTGIRGLYVYDNQLIMSMSSDTSDIKGVRILTTSNPSSGEWTEIANQDTFLDLPACYKRDGINGGGIWDIVSFNGYLYVSIVTSKTDPDTLVNNKQGFAMFRGSKEEDGTWSWKMIIGDKNQGALYDFGLGVKESGAGNLFVYDNYLYIGNYNDPMLDLAEIPNNGNFELVYNDLVNAVNLYRMDENENIEMVVGQPNEEFVAGPIGNMGPGFDDKYNHGLRTFQATEEGLFLGTANPFYGTQLWLLKDKDSFVEDDNNENPGDENDTPGEDSEISNDSTLKDTVEDSNKDQVIVVENQNNKDKQHNKLPVTGGINSAFVIVVAVILMIFGFKIYSYNRKQ